MSSRVAIVVGVLAVGLVAWVSWQQRRIDTLERDLSMVRARLHAGDGSGQPEQGATTENSAGPAMEVGPATSDRSPSDRPSETAGSAAPRVARELPARGTPQREVHDALVAVLDSGDPEVESRLRSIVQSEQESARDRRRERRQQMWEARTVERIDQLGEEAQLDQQTRDTLFAIFTAERDQMREAFRRAFEEQDFSQARKSAAELRARSDAEVRSMLSSDQYERYLEMRQQERARYGRGRP